MRIISGKHKGKRLIAPKKLPVRPTTDRAKEALFNIFENRYYFDDKTVLDLFSGTGNIGYEFASRGCKEIVAIDNNQNCLNYIKETAKDLNLNISTTQSDCLKYLNTCKQQFDFIFADPPYNYSKYQALKYIIFKKKLVKDDGCLVIEHNKDTVFEGDNIELRKYGEVHFTIFSF